MAHASKPKSSLCSTEHSRRVVAGSATAAAATVLLFFCRCGCKTLESNVGGLLAIHLLNLDSGFDLELLARATVLSSCLHLLHLAHLQTGLLALARFGFSRELEAGGTRSLNQIQPPTCSQLLSLQPQTRRRRELCQPQDCSYTSEMHILYHVILKSSRLD